jgi:hypothetical protein
VLCLQPSGDFSDVKDIPVHLKDSDILEDGVVQDACVLSHTVQEPCPPKDVLVSGVLKSELFGHCQQAIQMVVDATPSDQRVERLYKGQKGNSKELMPAFDIASVDADFQTSTLCVASSKSFGDLLVRLPTLCCSGVRINDQQLVHEGFGAVFREQQQELGKLSIGLRTGVGDDDEHTAAQPVADSTVAVLIQSYTPWLFGKLGQHYNTKLEPPTAVAAFLARASSADKQDLLRLLLGTGGGHAGCLAGQSRAGC